MSTYKYEVNFDIRYLDGFLKDMVIPSGHRCKFATEKAAEKHAGFFTKIRNKNSFVRAVATGNRYKVASEVLVTKI